MLIQDSRVSVSELPNLVDALGKVQFATMCYLDFFFVMAFLLISGSKLQLAMRPGSPESLQQLVEIARNPAANAAILSGLNVGKDDKEKQSREKKVD